MEFVLKAAMNPLTWIAILAAVVLFLHNENKSIKTELKAQKEVAERIETNIGLIQGDQASTVLLLTKIGKLKDRQVTISQKVEAIPDTSTCKPFEDANTLEAAQLFRDYQNAPK